MSTTVFSYIKGIRKRSKRQYAEQYTDYLRGWRPAEPTRPADVSYMAAQAVRMELHELVREAKP